MTEDRSRYFGRNFPPSRRQPNFCKQNITQAKLLTFFLDHVDLQSRPTNKDINDLANLYKDTIILPKCNPKKSTLKSWTNSAKKILFHWRVQFFERTSKPEEVVDQQEVELSNVEDTLQLHEDGIIANLSSSSTTTYTAIKSNIYRIKVPPILVEDTCDCASKMLHDCLSDCINHVSLVECGPKSCAFSTCSNRKIQSKEWCKNLKIISILNKGFGLISTAIINPGEFIIEYVGELVREEEYEIRRDTEYVRNKHYFGIKHIKNCILDATQFGSAARFINHSCEPNCVVEKWVVNKKLCLCLFSIKVINVGEEITFDYRTQWNNLGKQQCLCRSSNCRGYL